MSGGGAASHAIKVFGDMNQQSHGSDGSIAIKQVGGGDVPLMPGSSKSAVMSKKNRSRKHKGRGIGLAAIPASLLLLNQYYGRRRSSSASASRGGRRSSSRRSRKGGRRYKKSARR